MGTFRLGPSTVKMKVICPIVAIIDDKNVKANKLVGSCTNKIFQKTTINR